MAGMDVVSYHDVGYVLSAPRVNPLVFSPPPFPVNPTPTRPPQHQHVDGCRHVHCAHRLLLDSEPRQLPLLGLFPPSPIRDGRRPPLPVSVCVLTDFHRTNDRD